MYRKVYIYSSQKEASVYIEEAEALILKGLACIAGEQNKALEPEYQNKMVQAPEQNKTEKPKPPKGRKIHGKY